MLIGIVQYTYLQGGEFPTQGFHTFLAAGGQIEGETVRTNGLTLAARREILHILHRLVAYHLCIHPLLCQKIPTTASSVSPAHDSHGEITPQHPHQILGERRLAASSRTKIPHADYRKTECVAFLQTFVEEHIANPHRQRIDGRERREEKAQNTGVVLYKWHF